MRDMQVSILPTIDAPRQFLSRLEPLVPKGLGTGQLECLTGYLCRLADHHWLTPYALRKYAESYHLGSSSQPLKYYSLRELILNGHGSTTLRLATALNNATGRSDLLNLTFYHWAPALDKVGKGLLHQSLHWCSQCWKEDNDRDGEPYVRLAWMSSAASCCPMHNRLLNHECPHCLTEQRGCPSLPRPWICQQCGYELFKKGVGYAASIKSRPNKKQIWYARSIEKLILRTCVNEEKIQESCTEKIIDELAVRYAFGSSIELGSKLNIKARYLENWRTGKSRPTLLSLADLCYRLDIPLDQLLIDSDILTDPALWRELEFPHFIDFKKLSFDRKSEIKKSLQKIISSPPNIPPSVSEIASTFNISYTTLNSHFAKEYKILKKRALEWRTQRRVNNYEDRLQKLMKGIRELVKTGIYPSERQLRRYGYLTPSDLRRPEILSKLKELQSRHIYLMDDDD
jgi:transcriptional regulator with XRE-family HTH domain